MTPMQKTGPDAALSAAPASKRLRPGRFLRRWPALSLGLVLLALACVMAVFAPLLATHDPQALDATQRLKPPSAEAWFGTDMMGRDVYSRVIYGARVSLVVGFGVAVLATAAGMAIGLVAGFSRLLDSIIMRIMDGLMAIPSILLAIAFMAMLGSSVVNVIVAETISEIPRVARLVRSTVLSLREQTYVEAAITSGASTLRIIWRHILPNAMPPVLVQATYICASAMVIEAILSFIGAGTPPDIPSWGNIMTEGRALWQVKPHIVAFPAVVLSLTVLAVNLVGDGLRDMLDPRRKS